VLVLSSLTPTHRDQDSLHQRVVVGTSKFTFRLTLIVSQHRSRTPSRSAYGSQVSVRVGPQCTKKRQKSVRVLCNKGKCYLVLVVQVTIVMMISGRTKMLIVCLLVDLSKVLCRLRGREATSTGEDACGYYVTSLA
jgi:hypothetical protein